MNTRHAGDLPHLVDDVHAELHALFAPGLAAGLFVLNALASAFHTLHDLVGHVQARHFVPHVAGHSGRLDGPYAGQDLHPLVQATVVHLFHPAGELGHVVYELRLDEVHTGVGLLGQAGRPEVEGSGEGVLGCADEEARLNGDLLAALELLLIPHPLDDLDELDRVNVENVLRPWVVAEALVVAGKAEQVAHAQGVGPQQVALDGDAVAIPTGHLDNRLQADGHQHGAHADAGHAHHRRLVVGDVDGIGIAFQDACLLLYNFPIGALGRSQLRRDHELATLQYFLQVAI